MLVMLAASSGLRLGEILRLAVADVCADGTTITVYHQVCQSRLKDRLKTKAGASRMAGRVFFDDHSDVVLL